MTVSLQSLLTTSPIDPQKAGKLSAKPANDKSPEQWFLDYAKMTPAEKMHAAMLSQLGISEEEFQAMDSAAQQKIEDKIREMIKQQAEKTNDTRTGLITDKRV